MDLTSLSRAELEAEVLRLRAQRDRAPDGEVGSSARSAPAGRDELFSAVEKTRIPMILTDPNQPDDPIVFVNRAFQELSGYGSDELVGRNCRFLQGPDTDQGAVQRIRDALRDQRDLALDLLNYRRDGTPFVNELYISPVLGPDGEVLYHFGSQLDVTGIRKDRDRLEYAERRLRAVFASAVDFAIVVTDQSGLVTDWNNGAERILGWSAAEMRGQTVALFFTPEDRTDERPAVEMREALQDGRASDERWHVRRDGSRFWASGEMMPLREEGGGHQGFVKILRDRTEEHLAGKALADAEAALRRAQEAGGVGLFAVDIPGNILRPTAEFCRLYGLPTRDSYPAADFEALVIPEDAHLVSSAAARARGDAHSDVEYRIRRPDTGEVRWIARKGEIERDESGRPVRFSGVSRDVTERRAAREALRTGEERFSTILGTIDTAFAIVQVAFDADDEPVDYRFVEANPAFERQAGVNLRGRWVREFAPNLEPFWFETYGRVARTGEPANFESYAEAFGRWFDVRAIRVGDPDERQIAIFFSDSTERRVAEDRLRASEAVARENIDRVRLALAAGAIIGTWFWDLPSDRFTVDEAFARSFGLDPALGRDGIPLAQIVATVHPDDQAGLAEAIQTAIKHGGAYAHQYRTRRADGRYYWLEANGRVEHASDGTPLRFPGVLIDIEGRRIVEAERDRAAAALRSLNETLEQRVAERSAELMQAEEQLRQSQKMEAVGQLTGGVAHDFNNLLTIIRSSVDFLRRPDLPAERRERYMNAVSETVDRAAKLTGQLLAFARRQALKPEVFEAGGKLRGVADMLDTVTGARVRVAIELPNTPCFIKVDVNQFETALINMAVNARDAMDGAGTLSLRLSCGVAIPPIRGHGGGVGPFAKIEVSDTGSGIAPDDLARIFEPFFTTKEVGKGTGLGLSQVFGFAKQSGGDVDVSSELGRGTAFTLYLPVVEEAADHTATDEDVGPAPGGGGLRVLVVEDNIEVGNFATQILDDLGYRTEWVANAEAALEKLGADGDAFDAVFSDVVMPGMGGIALAEELRRRLPGLPVVLASGYSHVLAEEGPHGFELLHKPYSADQLSRVLRGVTRGRHRPAVRR